MPAKGCPQAERDLIAARFHDQAMVIAWRDSRMGSLGMTQEQLRLNVALGPWRIECHFHGPGAHAIYQTPHAKCGSYF